MIMPVLQFISNGVSHKVLQEKKLLNFVNSHFKGIFRSFQNFDIFDVQ